MRAESNLVVRRVLADGAAVLRMSRRIAHEILERHHGSDGLVLVGIRTGGWHWAERLARLIGEIEGKTPALGALDIALYRDDLMTRPAPEMGPTDLPMRLDGARVVLIDDVLYTGRTVRAALDALMDFGRPRSVRLAVLVDRGLRELPIAADFCGMSTETTASDSVRVELGGGDADRVVVRGLPGGELP
jgi:pyrimidine operon attenuation protein/uracil phosphoribosyltransferase